MFSGKSHFGDPVIFSLIKRRTHSSPRAREIRPEPGGEGYVYRKRFPKPRSLIAMEISNQSRLFAGKI
jgi:hypothetical protein